MVRMQINRLDGGRRCRRGAAAGTEHDQHQGPLLAVLLVVNPSGFLEILRLPCGDGTLIEPYRDALAVYGCCAIIGCELLAPHNPRGRTSVLRLRAESQCA